MPDAFRIITSVDEAERSATAGALRVRSAWLQSAESPFGVHDLEGQGYVYAKNELLVSARDYPRLAKALDRLNIEAKPQHSDELGVVRVQIAPAPGADGERRVPDMLAEIRKVDAGEGDLAEQPPLHIAPNHVFSGEPEYEGGPATWARPSQRKTQVQGRLGKGVHVSVIDTGYMRGVHPYMDEHVNSTGTPDLDTQPQDGEIDYEAGHSTFVAGMILRRAPQAQIDHHVRLPDTVAREECECTLVGRVHELGAVQALLALVLLHQQMVAAVPLERDLATAGLAKPLLGAAVGLQFGHKDGEL